MRVMSTSADGRASRKFIIGARLWPPAMILASSPSSPSRSTASPTVSTRWYSNEAGFTSLLPSRGCGRSRLGIPSFAWFVSTLDGGRMSVRVDRPAAGVLRVALDRPAARNAVDRAMADGLLAALGAVEPDVGAVVLGSADPGIFCAGADLKVPDAERATISDDLYEIVERMVTLPVPVVAAVGGPAVGGGAHLAVAADLRVAGPGAIIRVAGPGHGLAVAAWALPGLVGRARATDLCLTMREVNAPEALSIGLADRLADDPRAT